MATAAVTASATAMKSATTFGMEAAAGMTDVATATVVELRVMPIVVMLFPRMVHGELGTVVVAISPTI